MAEFSAGAMAFAALMLAGKSLEEMQRKGILFEDEAMAAIQAAVDQLDKSPNPDAKEAAQVLLHFYGKGKHSAG